MQWRAVQALADTGELAKPALPALADVVRDPSGKAHTRRAAAYAMTAIDPDAKATAEVAVPVFLREVEDTKLDHRLDGALALVRTRRAVDRAVAVLAEFMVPQPPVAEWRRFFGDSDPRLPAAFGLWQAGPEAKAVAPALRTMLDDKVVRGSWGLCALVAGALTKVDPGNVRARAALRELLPELIKALDGPDIEARIAAEALGASGRDAASAVPALQKAARSPDEALAEAARRALLRIEPAPKERR